MADLKKRDYNVDVSETIGEAEMYLRASIEQRIMSCLGRLYPKRRGYLFPIFFPDNTERKSIFTCNTDDYPEVLELLKRILRNENNIFPFVRKKRNVPLCRKIGEYILKGNPDRYLPFDRIASLAIELFKKDYMSEFTDIYPLIFSNNLSPKDKNTVFIRLVKMVYGDDLVARQKIYRSIQKIVGKPDIPFTLEWSAENLWMLDRHMMFAPLYNLGGVAFSWGNVSAGLQDGLARKFSDLTNTLAKKEFDVQSIRWFSDLMYFKALDDARKIVFTDPDCPDNPDAPAHILG